VIFFVIIFCDFFIFLVIFYFFIFLVIFLFFRVLNPLDLEHLKGPWLFPFAALIS